jgi:hypothetical protein
VCIEFYYVGWRIFTVSYWLDGKGGWFGVLVELALIGGVSVLPAIGIVVYYQSKKEKGIGDVPQK